MSSAAVVGRGAQPAIGFAEVPDFHVAGARRAGGTGQDGPLLVGGDPDKRGKVLAASADRRERGITAGLLVREALDRAPDARWVQTDMAQAREVSGGLRAAVRRVVEAIEVDGLGGFYMQAPQDPEPARALALRLVDEVGRATGLPLRVGIAPARFAARLVAEEAGPSGVRVLGESELDAWLDRQPIERLPGIGPKTAARLAELGATDVPGLRALGLDRLELLLGNHGRSLWLLASGEDPTPLRARRHPTSLSRAETLAAPSAERAPLDASLGRLAESLASALQREGLGARRIALRLRLAEGGTLTRSQTLEASVSAPGSLRTAAHGLLDRSEAEREPVRRVTLVVAGLEVRGAEDRQLDLF